MGGGLQAHVDSNSSLVLRPLTKEAHGRWECSASNAVARVAVSTTVYVLGLWLQSGAGDTPAGSRGSLVWGGPLSSPLPPDPHSPPGTSPHAVTNVSAVPVPRGANVSWEPGFDGGSPQKFSVWYTQL